MENDKSCEPTRNKNSTRSYASRVFQESSVGLVSSLAHTSSIRRRVFKVTALILCLTGFLYQSGKFLSVVFQYPTSVGLDIMRPETLSVPALTFCNNNGISRRIFCEKFPDRCEQPSEEFCKRYEAYCGENRTVVPKKEYYNMHSFMTLEDMIQLNVKKEDFVQLVGNGKDRENVTGPYLRMRDNFDSSLMCYSLYDRINNSLYPLQIVPDKLKSEAVNKIKFNVRADEMFLPGSRPGVLFAIHNPFQAVNPFEIGIFMKPGRTYMITVSMEEEVMLKTPYDTHCVNYTEIWEKNGRKGPRMQEMCSQKCLAELSMECYNCVYPLLIFVTNQRFCTQEEINSTDNCPKNFMKRIDKCMSICRDDCRRIKYTYTAQERYKVHFDKQGNDVEDIYNSIEVEMYLEGDEIVVLNHSPKYMIVEVFSSIGGFIGCWLGINLLDITDILEGFFRIIRYSFKRR